MAKGKKLPWIQATALAKQMVEKLAAPLCVAHVDTCGSIRRQKSEVADVDIVVTTETEDYDKVWATIPKGCEYETRGPVSRRFHWKGMKFDVRISKQRHRGAALLTRTGPAKFNIVMRGHAKKLGYKLNEYGVFKGDRLLTDGFSEQRIFEFLGLAYIPPEDRTAGVRVAPKTKKPDEWEVPSSSGNGTYTVKLENGELTCTCPGFTYRRSCRHVNDKASELQSKAVPVNPVKPRKPRSKHGRRPVYVRCFKCGDLDERDVEFLNIEEDIQGKDVMTFKCPECKKQRKSHRFA
jgi:hypothetical protein